MTGQWVSMGPLMGLMQQQQQQGVVPPYAMVGYNLAAPPQWAPGGMDAALMMSAPGAAMDGVAAAAGAGPGEAAGVAAPEKITISQTFAWQVRNSSRRALRLRA